MKGCDYVEEYLSSPLLLPFLFVAKPCLSCRNEFLCGSRGPTLSPPPHMFLPRLQERRPSSVRTHHNQTAGKMKMWSFGDHGTRHLHPRSQPQTRDISNFDIIHVHRRSNPCIKGDEYWCQHWRSLILQRKIVSGYSNGEPDSIFDLIPDLASGHGAA